MHIQFKSCNFCKKATRVFSPTCNNHNLYIILLTYYSDTRTAVQFIRYNDCHKSRMRLIDQRYKRHSNVLCRKTKPFRKVYTMILVGPRERATNGGMIDAYRGSRLPRRIRHIIHPRDTKDKRVLCYYPPSCAIDTIQISCTEYCWRCALVSHMRARRTSGISDI